MSFYSAYNFHNHRIVYPCCKVSGGVQLGVSEREKKKNELRRGVLRLRGKRSLLVKNLPDTTTRRMKRMYINIVLTIIVFAIVCCSVAYSFHVIV